MYICIYIYIYCFTGVCEKNTPFTQASALKKAAETAIRPLLLTRAITDRYILSSLVSLSGVSRIRFIHYSNQIPCSSIVLLLCWF